MKKYLYTLFLWISFTVFANASTRQNDPYYADSIPTTNADCQRRSKTILSFEGENLELVENNLSHFWGVNERELTYLYNKGVISKTMRTPDEKDQHQLKSILSSQTNIARDARTTPQELKEDVQFLLIFLKSHMLSYRPQKHVFSDVQEMLKVVCLLNKLCNFI